MKEPKCMGDLAISKPDVARDFIGEKIYELLDRVQKLEKTQEKSVIKDYKDLGYGSIQLEAGEWIQSPSNREFKIIRGYISLIPTEKIGIRLGREHTDFIIKVTDATDTISVYLKGCEVKSIIIFDEDVPVLGDVWDLEGEE